MLKKLVLKVLESKLLKGKLTSGGVLGGLVIPALELVGITDVSDEITAVVSGVAALVVLIGKARAVYQAQQGM